MASLKTIKINSSLPIPKIKEFEGAILKPEMIVVRVGWVNELKHRMRHFKKLTRGNTRGKRNTFWKRIDEMRNEKP